MNTIHYLVYDSADDETRRIDHREFDDEFVEVFIIESDTNEHQVFISFRLKKDNTNSTKFTGSVHTGSMSSIINQYQTTKYIKINCTGLKRRRLRKCLLECVNKIKSNDFSDLMFYSFMSTNVLETSIKLSNANTVTIEERSNVTYSIMIFIKLFSDLI